MSGRTLVAAGSHKPALLDGACRKNTPGFRMELGVPLLSVAGLLLDEILAATADDPGVLVLVVRIRVVGVE